jgi:adenylate kinase family enzyme
MNRIIITGDAGRGKSTLAERLSEKLDIPHYSTDNFYYEFKYFTPRKREEALEKISEIFDKEKWIVEGTTAWLLEPGMNKSERVVYLKYGNVFSQWFSLFRRHLKRKNESLKELFILMRHVLYKRYGWGYKKGKMTHGEFVEPYKEKLVVLSSFKDIDEFLSSL